MITRIAIGPSSFAEKDPTPRKMLEAKGLEIVPNPFGRRLTEEEIIAHLQGVDGLIAGLEPLNRRVLGSAAPRLRAIARVGIGMDNVDQAAARELAVKVSNTPDGPAQAVAELTLTAVLALCRNLVEVNEAFHGGAWPKTMGLGLAGTAILVVGWGRIGRRVGELARAFGARLLVYDPLIDEEPPTVGEQRVSLEEGLAQARIITLHAAGAQELLGAAEFAQMQQGVLLLNSARGELVNEPALLAALETGKVAGAWFDAFWKEPYSGPLLKFKQVLLTPHMGTYTVQCRRAMEVDAVKNLIRDLGLE